MKTNRRLGQIKADRYLLIGIAALLIAGFLVAAHFYKKQQRADAPPAVVQSGDTLVREYSPSEGPADAKVTVVEFMDPQCSTCRQFYPVVKSIKAEFAGKIRFVVRYLPFHNASVFAMSSLEATRDQGRYWEALEILFTNQEEWGNPDPSQTKPFLIAKYLHALGVDEAKLRAAPSDPVIQQHISQDQQDAATLNVQQTPTFFVNGKQVQELSEESVKRAITAALAPEA